MPRLGCFFNVYGLDIFVAFWDFFLIWQMWVVCLYFFVLRLWGICLSVLRAYHFVAVGWGFYFCLVFFLV